MQTCQGECLECNDTGGCRSCRNSMAYIPADQPGQCICLRSYPDPTSVNCSPCHNTCEECSGPLDVNCTVCHDLAELTAPGTCKCLGLLAMLSNGRCFQGNFYCEDAYCKTCKNAAERNPNFQQPETGLCNCPTQSNLGIYHFNYPDNSAGVCYNCGQLCISCALEGDLCYLCGPHSSLVRLTDLRPAGYCVCDRGYFQEDMDCHRCQTGCIACSSIVQCSVCAEGFELQLSDSQSTCVCAAEACKCPTDTFMLKQIGRCENYCPSGFVAKDGECLDSGETKFTWHFDNLYNVNIDSTGSFRLGTFWDNYPLYQRGLYIHLWYSNLMLYDSRLKLAPTFYIEIWSYNLEFSLWRYTTGSHLRCYRFRLLLNCDLQLRDFDGFTTFSHLRSESATSASDENPRSWKLFRIEFITKVIGTDIFTIIRSSENNVVILENSIRHYYYWEGSDDFSYSNFLLEMSQGENERFLGELTLANQIWSPNITPCGCSLCASDGYCLSTCPANQYPTQTTCGACLPSCYQGCVNGSDCKLNINQLCTSFRTFTLCESCKFLAILKNGVCECQSHAKFLSLDNSCVCEENYELSSAGNCEKCLNYLSLDDVSAEIDANFLSLTLTFMKQIAGDFSQCKDLFAAQILAKFGEAPTCIWSDNRKHLTVMLGTGATLMVEEVELNYETLLSIQGPCSFNAVKLLLKASYKGMVSVPQPVLDAPQLIGLSCEGVKSKQLLVPRAPKAVKGANYSSNGPSFTPLSGLCFRSIQVTVTPPLFH